MQQRSYNHCKCVQCDRGSISDGEKMSNKVMFSPKISRKVLDELVRDGKVTTIKLEIVEIIKDVIIGVLEFTVIEEGPRHVGDASFVGDSFYREM